MILPVPEQLPHLPLLPVIFTRLNALQNLQCVLDIRLIYGDRLEAALQRGILFDVLAVLVEGGGMEAWEQSIATAINGTLYGIAAVYDQMIEQGQGHIVNISSILGNYPVSGCGVYNVTKAAVRMLGDSLRVESRGKIKVTNIKPTSVANTGLVSTEVDYNAGLSGIYGKIIDAFMGLAIPDRLDTESIHCFDFSPSILADNIIYAIDQPWGVNISELTVRASGEAMFV